MSKRILARVTEPGWTTEVKLDGSGPLHASLLWYEDGTVRFQHHCDRGSRGLIVCAPALQTGPHGTGHIVTSGPTVTPSIACPDCGAHGFVNSGRWTNC